MRGRFVVFEGGEGSGKSTQAALLAGRLDAVLTREPGGTDIGARLRSVVLDDATHPPGARTEALLMAADRAQHVAEVVRPALEAGKDVVSDRFSGSTLGVHEPHQGDREGEGEHRHGLEADLVLLLDVDQQEAAARRCRPRDRMESAGDSFHQRVVAGYLLLAAADADRWVVIDGTGSVGEVSERVWSAFQAWATGAAPAIRRP